MAYPKLSISPNKLINQHASVAAMASIESCILVTS